MSRLCQKQRDGADAAACSATCPGCEAQKGRRFAAVARRQAAPCRALTLAPRALVLAPATTVPAERPWPAPAADSLVRMAARGESLQRWRAATHLIIDEVRPRGVGQGRGVADGSWTTRMEWR